MRKIIAVVLGSLIGSLLFFLIGMLINTISPTPLELMNPKTPEVVTIRVASTSNIKWIFTIIGLAMGALLAGFAAAFIAKESITWVTTFVGLLLSFWAFYLFYVVYPQVLWVPAGMLLSAFLFSYHGGIFYTKFKK